MYSSDNGERPKHFDNNFSDIAHVTKDQTKLTSLEKHNLPRMKTSLGELFNVYWFQNLV